MKPEEVLKLAAGTGFEDQPLNFCEDLQDIFVLVGDLPLTGCVRG